MVAVGGCAGREVRDSGGTDLSIQGVCEFRGLTNVIHEGVDTAQVEPTRGDREEVGWGGHGGRGGPGAVGATPVVLRVIRRVIEVLCNSLRSRPRPRNRQMSSKSGPCPDEEHILLQG